MTCTEVLQKSKYGNALFPRRVFCFSLCQKCFPIQNTSETGLLKWNYTRIHTPKWFKWLFILDLFDSIFRRNWGKELSWIILLLDNMYNMYILRCHQNASSVGLFFFFHFKKHTTSVVWQTICLYNVPVQHYMRLYKV
jgi:hypothetical protein